MLETGNLVAVREAPYVVFGFSSLGFQAGGGTPDRLSAVSWHTIAGSAATL